MNLFLVRDVVPWRPKGDPPYVHQGDSREVEPTTEHQEEDLAKEDNNNNLRLV